MKIENIQVLRGPNIWSVKRKKLIQMRLNLQEMEHQPTNKIEGFYERLKALIHEISQLTLALITGHVQDRRRRRGRR